MTLAYSRSFARVVVIAPRTRVDLALPVDVLVVDLLPQLLELVGERGDDSARRGGWKLAHLGGDELPNDRTLRSLDVLDGAALHLTPREAEQAPPIYDDVVDAIAATVQRRMSTRSTNPATGAAAAAVAMGIAAITLLFNLLSRQGSHATVSYLAAAAALLALGVGAAIARSRTEASVAVTFAAAGLPLAFLAGLAAVSADPGRSGVLLGFVFALAYSLCAAPALATGTVVFTATTLIAVFGAGTSLVTVLSDVVVVRALAGAAALGIAAISVLPWLVVRLARLPLPMVPTSTRDLDASDAEVDIADVEARARVADEYFNGAFIGCAAVAAFSAAAVALHGTAICLAFSVVTGIALAMRTRTVAGLVPRAAIFAAVLAAALFAGGLDVAIDPRRASLGIVAVALIAALLAVLLAVGVGHVRISPATARTVEVFEAFLLIAILPLMVGVMDLYATMRHL